MAKCSNCNAEMEYHVNKVYAEKGNLNYPLYISGAVLLAVLMFITYFSSERIFIGLLAVPVFVYLKLKSEQEKSIELFNEHKISEKRS